MDNLKITAIQILQSKYGYKDQESENQVPNLIEDTNVKATSTNESQEVSHFPAGAHKAHLNRRTQRHTKHKKKNNKRSTKEVPPWNGQ